MIKPLFVAALIAAPLAAPLAAYADEDTAPVETVAPPDCKKPVLPSKVRRADDPSEFTEKFEKYQKCVLAYADAQGKLAKAHQDAANAAINEFNAFVKSYNDSQQDK